ncbi:tRNA (Guanine-1)-methyltransferase domain-containing protein [Ditylenchus destructor]|uniref:tRNA (Guanine-1)-methyltransferase domain-containing protein n=1 Tax=Ditylenchus destructor TaxID=166010 RepID=A0AAD4N6G0_9BILA|nr:tRNA (Guanine-1)-methyltransferase domain-containing protein [Ditylenchus destructor]
MKFVLRFAKSIIIKRSGRTFSLMAAPPSKLLKIERNMLRNNSNDAGQSTPATVVSLEVLSSGTAQIGPCAFIRTPLQTYLFNIPEGVYRYGVSLGLRTANTFDIFLTRPCWKRFGGLPGFLLSKYSTTLHTRLHGVTGVHEYLASIRPFLEPDNDLVLNHRGNLTNKGVNGDPYPVKVTEHSYEMGTYEDNVLRVHYIPMFDIDKSPDLRSCAPVDVDVAFLVELKDLPPSIDILKIMKLQIPKGPVIGRLKAGETITLDDGRVIKPEDVQMTPSNSQERTWETVLFVDVESRSKLQSLKSSPILKERLASSKTVDYVVHFTKPEVFCEAEYSKWMKEFGDKCEHLILNGSGAATPLTDGIYFYQNMLNTLDPTTFPKLHISDFRGSIPCEVSMRGSFGMLKDKIDMSDPLQLLNEKLAANPGVKHLIDEHVGMLTAMKETNDKFPSIVVLGTSSAIATRYRNVSSYLLQLHEETYLMIDAGEGTLGQLISLYGPEECDRVLCRIRALYFTHSHQDHTMGLFQLIIKRREAFERQGIPYQPLVIVSGFSIRKSIALFSPVFEDLSKYIVFVDNSVFKKHPTELNSDVQRPISNNFGAIKQPTVIEGEEIDNTMFIPKRLFSKDEWNLASVEAVPVHHIRDSVAYVFVDAKHGRKIVFSGDTQPCNFLVERGKNADVLIHEATFDDSLTQDARRKRHSTMRQAVDIGYRMNAKHIILTHFSSRYTKCPIIPDYVVEQGNISIAMDFMIASFDRLNTYPRLLPIYKKLFAEEIFESQARINKTEMQKNSLNVREVLTMANLLANIVFDDDDKDIAKIKHPISEYRPQNDVLVAPQVSEENRANQQENGPTLSKSQLKKQKKQAKWLETKSLKRKMERIRRKEKKAALRESGADLCLKKPPIRLMSESKCKIRVAVDMAYDKIMSDICIRKTVSQLSYCYATNRRANNPLQYYIVNLREQSKSILDKFSGSHQWDVFVLEDSISEIWRKEDIVYLTAESENVLESLQPDKAYVIGGLLDHNSQKGLCHSIAIDKGYSHARLPIDEFVKMRTRKVLTINQVFEILLRFSESQNWEEAFFSVIPKRKGPERLEKPTGSDEVELSDSTGAREVVELSDSVEMQSACSIIELDED